MIQLDADEQTLTIAADRMGQIMLLMIDEECSSPVHHHRTDREDESTDVCSNEM